MHKSRDLKIPSWRLLVLFLLRLLLADDVLLSGELRSDLYAITRSDGLAQWLQRKGLIRDFTDEDCVKCNYGKMRLVKDASYSKDKACWRCSIRQCNSKVSIRRGTWFESSHLSMSQVLELTYFWVYECTE